MAKRKRLIQERRRKGKGGFLLGTLVGVAGGVAGGTALLKRSGSADSVAAAVPAPVADATGQAVNVAQRAPSAAAERARGGLDALKERWREAVAEGKVAAAERERELREQFERDTKRIPPVDAPPMPPTAGGQ